MLTRYFPYFVGIFQKIHIIRRILFVHALMQIHQLSLLEIVQKIKSRELSQKEVYDHFKNRIAEKNPELNAFLRTNEITGFPGLETALAGVPIGLKDVYCEKGVITSAGSKMLADFVPPYDATLVINLKDAGMVSMGKLNTDEFTMGKTVPSALPEIRGIWNAYRAEARPAAPRRLLRDWFPPRWVPTPAEASASPPV